MASFVYFSRVRSVIKCYHVTYNVTFVVRGCNRVSVSYKKIHYSVLLCVLYGTLSAALLHMYVYRQTHIYIMYNMCLY